MDLRGQRFKLNLSDDEDECASTSRIPANAMPSIPFVSDIKERSTTPPTAPKMKTTPTGFPEHKKRTRISAFKQQRGGIVKSTTPRVETPAAQALKEGKSTELKKMAPGLEEEERQQIDEENRQRLAAMSSEEIVEEREELLAGLNPSLIERLLKRANLDDGRGDTGIDPPFFGEEKTQEITPKFEEPVPAPISTGKPVAAGKSVRFEEEEEPLEPTGLQPAADSYDPAKDMDPAIHFPSGPPAPDLDPSDPSFLENLHNKYFPNLPNDPSKLAWMAPIPTHGSIADQESPYYPAHEALPASALRFDFRGGILPPRIARAMPTTKGLHHHGEAPEAAGYTVPELARLARSAYPAQRCIAFQTLGRLLYRLGRGEWGDEDNEINKGLWRCVEEGKIIETFEQAAGQEGGHQGSKVYAVEAAWLWQRGGGKRWKAS